MGALDVRVERGLPKSLPGGSSTALFIAGTCFHERCPIKRLELIAGGVARDVTAHGQARIDFYRKLHPPSEWGPGGDDLPGFSDPAAGSYRSGFWGTVPLRVPASGQVEVAVRATLRDGSTSEETLGVIEAGNGTYGPPVRAGGTPRIAICMATFDPDPELFRAQIDSIREQTLGDWVCLISDDSSARERFGRITEIVDGDPRFVVSRSPMRQGFYRNFERALEMVPAGTEFVAFSDQDDRWYPDKLEGLVDGLGSAQLVYSDQRLVDVGGKVISDSFWDGERTNNHTNLVSLLIANTVTGAASLFRRELLTLALPFPDVPGQQYHDHWLALMALSTGTIAYVDRPLYDYVQHGGAALGYEGGNGPRRGLGRGLGQLAENWRVSYFHACCRLTTLAEVLLVRTDGQAGLRSRRALRRIATHERSGFAVLWLFARRSRRYFGRNETLGAERILLIGILWKHAMALLSRLSTKPIRGISQDVHLPDAAPIVQDSAMAEIDHPGTRVIAALVQPLQLSISERAPERVNLLMPTIELQHLFGGYIAKFNLARKLAEQGMRVRILTVDPTPPLPAGWRRQVEAYAGLSGLFDQVEVGFARDVDAPIEVNPRDSFVATTWWTARIAHAALEGMDRSRFLYLIQEYEPFTHPMSSYAAGAISTYDLPHVALFSTPLLRDYFAERSLGVFSDGRRPGTERSLVFENAITPVSPPSADDLAARETRRLLFYARPEPHGARNMFELGLMSLCEAVSQGVFGSEWSFSGIGAVTRGDRLVNLSRGSTLELLSKRSQGSYGDLLGSFDVGLSLMLTPHPSLVPLEMASAGMLTVTNSFETKTPAAMAAISANLITVPAWTEGVVAGLAEAVDRVGDIPGRVAGARMSWSRDWDTSLDVGLMAQLETLLLSC